MFHHEITFHRLVSSYRKVFEPGENINLLIECEGRTGDVGSRSCGSTATTEGKYAPVRPSRSVSKLLIIWHSVSDNQMHCQFQFLHQEFPDLQASLGACSSSSSIFAISVKFQFFQFFLLVSVKRMIIFTFFHRFGCKF